MAVQGIPHPSLLLVAPSFSPFNPAAQGVQSTAEDSSAPLLLLQRPTGQRVQAEEAVG
jgi:hypothetical protein